MNRSAAWETCWAVNNAFVMKPETVPYLECVECQGRLQSNKRYSSVLMKAIEWDCGHQRSGYLCTKCDVDYLLLVTQGQQRCSNPHCKTFVKVNLEEVEDRLQRKPDILARYRELAAFECIVCAEYFLKGGRTLTKACEHERDLCDGCAADMIDSAVTTGGWSSIRCPTRLPVKCGSELGHEDVRAVALRDTFERYEELVNQKAIKAHPNYSQCNRPYGECQFGQIHVGGIENPRMQCTKCNYVSCFACTSPWHEGQTCKEFLDLLGEDRETDEHKKKYCKRCPGAGCGVFTKKVSGCPEMTCGKVSCGVHWCWHCKIILNTSISSYSERLAPSQHLSTCVKSGPFQGFRWPRDTPKYRPGWQKDDGFVGTGQEDV